MPNGNLVGIPTSSVKSACPTLCWVEEGGGGKTPEIFPYQKTVILQAQSPLTFFVGTPTKEESLNYSREIPLGKDTKTKTEESDSYPGGVWAG
ncbi:hypothetical protein [Leptospira adleri]|uniref:Uncharacterized protein n=1 Tax=Leptospira adleri TaxID=2023186 RepID=A0ABX4NUE0_9LEPT|nr:hypothetical protein [Leptospira adleri]PJZ60484.1 hypothetical protein CH376_18160 [Leptospira adleri]